MKNSEIGSFLAGIGATEDIDSSGEIIEIKGIDHSSLLKDGKVHFEHKNDNSSQVIGKIVDCKKILKESDCEHELHKYFWEKARKRPYMYVAAVLFDKMGHQGAKDALAQAKFDQHLDTDKTNGMSWWSIEGSRLDKEGNRIKKCIARDWAYTHRPCNKACIAELLTDEQADKFIPQIAKKKVQDSMKKSMAEEADLKKSGTKYFKQLARVKNVKTGQKSTRDYTPITTATGEHREGIKTQPKRIFSSMAEAPERAKVGDRILHNKPKVRSGASIYKDPETWKKEIDTENPLRKAVKTKIMRKKEDKYHIYEGKQRITSTPLSLKEINEKHGGAKKIESSGYRLIPHKEENGLTSMKKNKILKSIINETWDVFKHKDLLIETIKKNQPHLSQEDVLNVAKTYVYIDMKKQENELEDLFEKSKKGRCWEGYEPTPGKKPYSKGSCQPIKKAKVSEGKTKKEKQKTRAERAASAEENENKNVHSPSEAGARNYADPKSGIKQADKKRMRFGLTNFKPLDEGQRKHLKEIHNQKMKNIKSVIPKLPKSKKMGKSEDFKFKADHKSDKGGLTEKGRKAYNKATGSNLKRPQPEGGKRKKSFCARNKGQIDMHNIDCKKDPEKRACKARKRWKCTK